MYRPLLTDKTYNYVSAKPSEKERLIESTIWSGNFIMRKICYKTKQPTFGSNHRNISGLIIGEVQRGEVTVFCSGTYYSEANLYLDQTIFSLGNRTAGKICKWIEIRIEKEIVVSDMLRRFLGKKGEMKMRKWEAFFLTTLIFFLLLCMHSSLFSFYYF